MAAMQAVSNWTCLRCGRSIDPAFIVTFEADKHAWPKEITPSSGEWYHLTFVKFVKNLMGDTSSWYWQRAICGPLTNEDDGFSWAFEIEDTGT